MSESFTQTSDLPYDRHRYKLVYTNGQSIIFESYQEVREAWWNTPSNFANHIEVLDHSKGFKS